MSTVAPPGSTRRWPHFPNAPIVEALLDIRAIFDAPVPLARLELFHEAIRDSYPGKLHRATWESAIEVAEDAVQQAVRRSGPDGFLFKSKDGRRTVQVRQDGLTFNWLKPYDRWEALRDETRVHWGRYVNLFKPQAVPRVALRYINRLELPLPLADFRDFVHTAPGIAPGLPQGLRTFFMRLEIPDTTRELIAIVTETMQPPVEEGTRLPFILDIDVMSEAAFEPSGELMWEKLEELRNYKNEIFFHSITDRAKELFR